MARKVTVTYRASNTGTDVTVAEAIFAADSAEPAVLRLQTSVQLPSEETVTLSSSCVKANGNVSVAVFCGTEQLSLVTCRWDQVAPYLGVRLPKGAWLHLYFDAGAPE